jgi:hypothetical protein
MGYSVKRGKLAKRKLNAGDVIHVSYGRNSLGFWWAETEKEIHGLMDLRQLRHGGPFRTQEEAQRDSEIKLLGPQCEIAHGGMWDPKWDQPQ